MRFRLTVTQLRIVILVTNLLLSAGVLAYAGYSYYSLTEQKEDLRLADLKDFTWSESQARFTTKSGSANELQKSAEDLQPKKPERITTTEPTKTEPGPTATASEPGAFLTGPLGEKSWKFVTYVVWPDSPLDNQAILKKESDQPGPSLPGRSTSRTIRPRTVIRPTGGPARAGQPGARGLPRNNDRVAVTVRDRVFTIEDGSETSTYLVEAVDEKQFVYSEWSKPGVFYALPYEVPGEYLGKPEEGLKPAAKPADGTADAATEEKKSLIQIVPIDFEDKKEEDYERMKKGGKPGPAIEIIAPASTAAAPGAPGVAPSAGSRSTPGVPRPPTAEEKRQLREVFQSSKIKPEDRQKLQNALRGISR